MIKNSSLFTFVTTILILCLTISNGEAAPTQRGPQGKLQYHREDLTVEPSRNRLNIVDAYVAKEAGGNLQDEQEQEEEQEDHDEQEQEEEQVEQERRQVAGHVKDLLKQLRQLGRWTVKVKAKRTRDDEEDETSRQNWESEIQPRDSRAGLHGNGNSHGTLISKGW